ncbi:hypothetical protein CEXT_236481 [Caerostris extrusa]|uniref:Uncharacterized protein n=1 Tax=Caerostris extrusa TaxID=172846 RepID=A0AAV4RVK9_CAEEX|nr:hypothetical protein CEXT_236481 [Caerostris extrusa]
MSQLLEVKKKTVPSTCKSFLEEKFDPYIAGPLWVASSCRMTLNIFKSCDPFTDDSLLTMSPFFKFASEIQRSVIG